jgi:hypothetical protein
MSNSIEETRWFKPNSRLGNGVVSQSCFASYICRFNVRLCAKVGCTSSDCFDNRWVGGGESNLRLCVDIARNVRGWFVPSLIGGPDCEDVTANGRIGSGHSKHHGMLHFERRPRRCCCIVGSFVVPADGVNDFGAIVVVVDLNVFGVLLGSIFYFIPTNHL